MLKVPDGTLRMLVQGGQRVRVDAWVRETPYLVAEISELPDVVEQTPELTALMRNVQQTFSQIVEAVPYLPEELQIAVANVEDPEHAEPPHRRLAAPADRGEAGAAGGGRRRPAPAPPDRGAGPRARGHLDRLARSRRRCSPRWTAASASTSCASSSRRSRRSSASSTSPPPRPRSCASSSTQIDLPEDVRKQADRELRRLENLPPAAAEHGVIRTYLEWIAVAAVGQDDRGQPRPRPRARGPRRGPLRPRAGQGPHPRVPRRPR